MPMTYARSCIIGPEKRSILSSDQSVVDEIEAALSPARSLD